VIQGPRRRPRNGCDQWKQRIEYIELRVASIALKQTWCYAGDGRRLRYEWANVTKS
jgi:hypothetical protein